MLDFPATKRGAAVLNYTAPEVKKAKEEKAAQPIDLKMPGLSGLEKYISELGLRVSDLKPAQIAILETARSLVPLIKDLKIPVATVVSRENKTILVEKEKEEIRLKTRYRDGHKATEIPDNSMDIVPISSASELPSLRATEWMVEALDEGYFLNRLSQNSLLRNQWMKTDKVPERGFESVKVKELVEEPAPPEVLKQHAAVLLDISGSMQDSVKAPLAIAIAIAFLKHGYDNEAMLNVRKFDDNVHPALVGKTQGDLTRFVRNLLDTDMDGGGTNIQWAIKKTAENIQTDGATKRADILLLTDGLSKLDKNPLGKIKLHTFLIGIHEDPNSLSREEREAISTLKSWSETFKTLNAFDYQDVLTPGPRKELRLAQNSRAILQLIEEEIDNPENLKILKQRLKDLLKLMEFEEDAESEEEDEFIDLEEEEENRREEKPENPLKDEMEKVLGKIEEKEAEEERRKMEAEQKARMEALEKEARENALAELQKQLEKLKNNRSSNQQKSPHELALEDEIERMARREAAEKMKEISEMNASRNSTGMSSGESDYKAERKTHLEKMLNQSSPHEETLWQWCKRKVKEWWQGDKTDKVILN